VTGRAGFIREDELWVRCPFCGDSQNDPDKAHFSINADGLYYCLKCHTGGRLGHKEFLAVAPLFGREQIEVTEATPLPDLIPGSGNLRPSRLHRFHLSSGEDAFQMRDQLGNVIGIASVGDHRRIYGKRGLGYRNYLVSSVSHPLIIVEGPYDVLYDDEVCMFGLPSPASLQMLKGQFIILCPDGDLWIEPAKTKILVSIVRRIIKMKDPILLGVQVIPGGLDPDEHPRSQRTFVTKETFVHDLCRRGPSRGWKEYLDRFSEGGDWGRSS